MFLNKMPRKIIIVIFLAFTFFKSDRSQADAGEIRMTKSLPALPVMAGVTQHIEISIPDGAQGEIFEAEIEAKSGWGILLFTTGPSNSGKARISRELPIKLDYRWSGATPVNASATEIISVDIPKLGLSAEMEFQVGVDVRITGISLPANVSAGVFNPAEISVRDAFNPSLDLIELLGGIGTSLEISMSLAGQSKPVSAVPDDPIVSAFFGEKNKEIEQSYPGKNFKPGSLELDGEKFVWRDGEGRAPGITPPSAGRYNIEAALKANLGGAPLKHWSSPAFDVSGGTPSVEGMPAFFASTLAIMSRFDAGASSEAEKHARELLNGGDAQGAITSLGSSLRKAFGASPLQSLGKYAAALASSGRGEDEISNFLSLLMKGFDDCGILLFTRSGVSEWSVEGGSVYENERYVSVPFSPQKNISVKITGSDAAEVSLWKIIAQGTNMKKYPKGNWVKEVTVYTAEVKPPRKQTIN